MLRELPDDICLALVFSCLACGAAPWSLAQAAHVYVSVLCWAFALHPYPRRHADVWQPLAKDPRTGQRSCAATCALAPWILASCLARYCSARAAPIRRAWVAAPLTCNNGGGGVVAATATADAAAGLQCSASCHVFVGAYPRSPDALPRHTCAVVDVATEACLDPQVVAAVPHFYCAPCFHGTLPPAPVLRATLRRVAVDVVTMTAAGAPPPVVCVVAPDSDDGRASVTAALLVALLHTGSFDSWHEHLVRLGIGADTELQRRVADATAHLVDE